MPTPFSRFRSRLFFAATFLSVIFLSARAQITIEEVQSGELLLLTTTPGFYQPAPRVESNVTMQVSGMIARVTVLQRFENPSADWAEAVYAFPLPEDAAVDTLKMRVGEHTITGEIREREEAQAMYTSAKNAGQRTSLLEQERPNLFTTSVANIAPGESVTIEISYQETLRYDAGEFSLRFPLAITPRYSPAGASATEYVNPPYQQGGSSNTVTLNATINTGFSLSSIESRYHAVDIVQEDHRYHVMLNGEVPADRDFELVWTPDVGTLPEAVAFTETWQGESYGLVMLVPPQLEGSSALNREVTFIIDTSGSMEGTSILQAKEALRLALTTLKPTDRFNVIEFNSVATSLFTMARDATPDNVRLAEAFVSQLVASGGTEMRRALGLAFQTPPPNGYLGQVVFMTDGSVDNETELFDLISRKLGQARLFTVGIGSAPNSYFMRKAAEFGRGSYTFISDLSETQQKMSELFLKLEQPVLMSLEVQVPAGSEMYPKTIPDLYRGEPVIISVKLPESGGEVLLSGNVYGERWERRLYLNTTDTELGLSQTGVSQLWARAKIEALNDEMIRGGNLGLEQDITTLALHHHLVTDYTSLVVVDNEVVRPVYEELQYQDVLQNLPLGQTLRSVANTQAVDSVVTATAVPETLPAQAALESVAPMPASSQPQSVAVSPAAESEIVTSDVTAPMTTPSAEGGVTNTTAPSNARMSPVTDGAAATTEQTVAVAEPAVTGEDTTEAQVSGVSDNSAVITLTPTKAAPTTTDSRSMMSFVIVALGALLLVVLGLARARR